VEGWSGSKLLPAHSPLRHLSTKRIQRPDTLLAQLSPSRRRLPSPPPPPSVAASLVRQLALISHAASPRPHFPASRGRRDACQRLREACALRGARPHRLQGAAPEGPGIRHIRCIENLSALGVLLVQAPALIAFASPAVRQQAMLSMFCRVDYRPNIPHIRCCRF
jgi:hypothetical protein